MFDYRNHLRRILQKTTSDPKSLNNSLAAIQLIISLAKGKPRTKVKSQTSKVHGEQTNQNQLKTSELIKQLLIGVTKLLQKPGAASAKESTLKIIHQLTFVRTFAHHYGHELSQLEDAVRRSATTTTAINAHLFKKAVTPKSHPKRDYRKGNRYTVIRLLSGADLVNDAGQRTFTVKESQIHALNLRSGDIVEALPAKNNPHYEAEILRVVGYHQLPTNSFDQIDTFKFGVVQGRPNQLGISHNIHGQKLRIRGKQVTVPVDASYYQGDQVKLEDGSIADLAWYRGDVRLKKDPASAIKIRWIYQLQNKRVRAKSKPKKTSRQTEVARPKLALNLHYQRVGIAIGDRQNDFTLEKIVTQYHGIPIPIDAFEGRRQVLEQAMKNLDLVILVTAYAAHASAWGISNLARKYHVHFAVASSKGYWSFARALYRAYAGLPAYEGTQRIDYHFQKSK